MNAPSIADALRSLAVRGITCTPTVRGTLEVRPTASLTGTDRDWLRKHSNEAVAYLVAGEPWNLAAALRLMEEADGAVAASGVSGSRPEVQTIVEVIAAAYGAKQLRRVRLACEALGATVKRLTGAQCESPGPSVRGRQPQPAA